MLARKPPEHIILPRHRRGAGSMPILNRGYSFVPSARSISSGHCAAGDFPIRVAANVRTATPGHPARSQCPAGQADKSSSPPARSSAEIHVPVHEPQRQSVQSAMSFYQLLPADILIVLDDLALNCGRLRLRGSGTSGGHNGLKDIERVLGTNEYPRLRIGIDPTPAPMRQGLCARSIHHRATKVARTHDRSRMWRDPDLDGKRNCIRDEPVQRGRKTE